MADLICNIMKGKFAYYAGLPETNDALIIVPLETTGLATDDTIRDVDDLNTLLGGTTNEQTTMGRKTVTTSVTVLVDDTNNWMSVDFPDPVWAAATGNAISALLVCYDPDTTGGDDADLVPISKHDFVATPDGSDLTGTVATGGFARAS